MTYHIYYISFEGPKKQDIAEIKARATSAQTRSKYGEMMERVNLAYSRIMINCDSTVPVEEDEKSSDVQFQLMVKLVKETKSKNQGSKVELHSLGNSYTSPSRRKDTLDLILSVARSIFVRREINSIGDKFYDPFDLLLVTYPNGHEKNLLIRLGLLDAMLVVAKGIKGHTVKGSSLLPNVDQRALDTGKELLSHLVAGISKGQAGATGTTLFSNNRDIPESNLNRGLKEAREHFTRAVSFYYSVETNYRKATEWCDLLIEILLASQQYSYRWRKEEIPQDSFDHIISEIMATKALSLCMTKCYGAALKTAREAWEKCGAEVGNLVTLFHCSVQYESFSDLDDSSHCAYTNTLFELDNAISSFSSLSKLTTSIEANNDKLLEAFPVMCNTATQLVQGQTGPLLLGLQGRYVSLLVNSLSMKILEGDWNISDVEEKAYNIPGQNNVFGILCSYLESIDTVMSSPDYKLNKTWHSEQLQSLQKTLNSVLKLLVMVRDQGMKSKNSLLQFSEAFREVQPTSDVSNLSLFENTNICHVIGNSEDCLWIGKIYTTHIMSRTDL
jgi:hypothetical protein